MSLRARFNTLISLLLSPYQIVPLLLVKTCPQNGANIGSEPTILGIASIDEKPLSVLPNEISPLWLTCE